MYDWGGGPPLTQIPPWGISFHWAEFADPDGNHILYDQD